MIELTADDRAEIDRVRDEWRESWSGEPAGDSLAILDEMLARRFLAAGIERAAAALDNTNPMLRPSGCAIVIRALLK